MTWMSTFGGFPPAYPGARLPLKRALVRSNDPQKNSTGLAFPRKPAGKRHRHGDLVGHRDDVGIRHTESGERVEDPAAGERKQTGCVSVPPPPAPSEPTTADTGSRRAG